MGASLSMKRRVRQTGERSGRTNSIDFLSRTFNHFPIKHVKNNSCDNILSYNRDPSKSNDVCVSHKQDTVPYYDVTKNRFLQKVRSYLRSLEQISQISKLKFYYGNLVVKTESGEESNLEIHEQEYQLGEALISLEPQRNQEDLFFIYTYCATAKGMNASYTHLSMIYITNVHRSTCKYHIIQAKVNPHDQLILVPRKIRVPDNPVLTSPNSRFVAFLESETFTRSMLLFLSNKLEPFFVAQCDMSLDLSRNNNRAVVLNFKPQYFE